MQTSTLINFDLGSQWAAWRTDHPYSGLRDDARDLGVSEAELLATGCGSTVTRLCGGWVELLRGLQELGPVAVQTESNGSLIEARGSAVVAGWSGRCGMVRVGVSRLRVQLDHIYHCYAVTDAGGSGMLHFCDADGQRVLTIGQLPETMGERWAQLVRRFASAEQHPWVRTAPVSAAGHMIPDSTVDVKALRAAWDGLRGPLDFTIMLQRFSISRAQAVRLAGESRAQAVAKSTFSVALRCASNAMVPLALSVESAGVTQVYTGLTRRVEASGGLLALIEPGFRLYVSEPRIKSAWLVRRPSEQGVLSSLQYFDADDQPVLRVAGNTTPGEPGLKRWERLVASLS